MTFLSFEIQNVYKFPILTKTKVIKEFFIPKTVAIIGASDNKNSIGYSLMKNMSNFKGKLIPINPKYKKVNGKRCYNSILKYKGAIDLAVVVVPAHAVAGVLIDCGKKNVKAATIISAGFSEIGNKKDEEELKLIAKKYKLRIMGPNCISGDSSILITNNKEIKFKQIGPFIEDLMEKYKNDVINISGTYILDLKHCDREFNVASFINGEPLEKKINKIMKRVSNKLLKITCVGGHEILCSEDHPILVRKNNRLVKIDACNLKANEDIPIIKEIKFKAIRKLDYINILENCKGLSPNIKDKIRVEYKNKIYDFNKFIRLKDINLKEVKLFIKHGRIFLPALLEISEELCKLIGFFIADGNYKKECLRIGYVGCESAEREIRKCINKVFNSNLIDLSRSKDIKFGRRIGRLLFKDIFKIGEGTINKRIPDFIFNSSEKNIIAFLNGLYSGDGCIHKYKNKDKSTLTIASISKVLIDQINYLYTLLGVGPFYKQFVAETKGKIKGKEFISKKQYILRTDSSQVIKDLYRRGFRFLVKNKNDILIKIFNKGYNFPRLEKGPIYFRKIKKIELIHNKCSLYDLEVEDSHTFIANHILTSNCFGSVNPYIGLDCSFALSTPEKGNIAFIAQSGALWVYLVEYSKDKFGFSGYASLGNMADVDFSDCIEYFNNDKNTKVIVCYIENLKDGKRFIEVCKKCRKPIIAIKVGRGEAGTKAALSHTGSLAGSFEIYKAAFKQAGVILADNITEALDKAELLVNQKPAGKKVVIITNGGGAGVMAADLAEENNLEIIDLPKEFIKKLNLPNNWSHGNPMDLVGDANYDRYKEVFTHLKKEDFYDSAIIIISQQKMVNIEKTALEIVNFKRGNKKTIICILMGNEKEIKKAEKILRKNKISCFFEIKRAVETLRGI